RLGTMTLQAPIQPYEQPPASRREPCDQGANAPEESHRAPRRCRAGTPRKFLGAWTSHIRPRKSVSPCVDTPRLQSSSRGGGGGGGGDLRITPPPPPPAPAPPAPP